MNLMNYKHLSQFWNLNTSENSLYSIFWALMVVNISCIDMWLNNAFSLI